jgi:2-polyprenyl-3-methyl-5-hydroxy-6-metoxy-1,4-benzoquinol methylase
VAVTRYSTQVDLENLNSSHSLAILSVAPGARVLDLGAADGSVARRLKERGCTVCAVESDTKAAEAARAVCNRVIVADLETEDAWQALEGETFDCILALDVLEHLKDPEAVLKRAVRHLCPEGMAIVSIPNVTHGAVRLSLLQGRFRYMEKGPLDRTHLRFFDRAGAEQLVLSAGLAISERLRVTRALEETEVPVTAEGTAPEVLEAIAADPDATIYQFVFVARRRIDETVAPYPGAMLSERLLTELERLKARFAEVEQYARNLAADRERLLGIEGQVHEVKAELGRRMAEAQQRHLELRYAKAEIAVKQAFIDELRQDLQAEPRKFDETERALRLRLEAKARKFDKGMQAAAERTRALKDRIARLETEVRTLRAYASSPGFRLVEKVIAGLKRIPLVYRASRALVRALAGGPAPRSEASTTR